ncbi:hypothetical protein OXX69_001820 [Metschnikowia pulcherrima]
MSKGKLKVALKNQKAAEEIGKKAGKKQQKPVKPVLEDPEESSSSESEEVPSLIDTSAPLSKKEKRKLKKMIAKAKEAQPAEESEESDAEEELDLEKLAASESESDINDDDDDDDDDDDEDSEEDDENNEGSEEEKDEDDEEAEEEDIPLSDAELDSDADVVPHSKLTVNNIAALKDSLARIALPWENHSFVEHQAVLAAEKAEAGIKDLYDDTERELAFYRQGLDAVKQGRSTLLKLNVPFSRPLDYFAEMVKSDEHMDKLKGKLLKEAADKKASEDAKKQRQLKKFGKKVQHETLQERAKQKRDTLDRIKSLKKKRGANELSNDSEFQIALEEATAEDRPQKRAKPNGKRLAKDAKYGSGGQKRGMRRNDAESSADIFNQRGKKGKPARPGKSKRSRN